MRTKAGLVISSSVQYALKHKRPVVALESTIIAHGMPYPQNKEMALQVEKIIQVNGAEPATIAILNGRPHIGLSLDELTYLAEMGKQVRKCSVRDIAYTMTQGQTGATTVASTMHLAHLAGIQVFVTGGIGGVHRGYDRVLDISADLIELARTPICVVSSGVKSILDIGNTLEYLETNSVPVIGYQTSQFPAFFTADSGFPAPLSCASPEEIAEIIATSKTLQLSSGLVVGVPNPAPLPQSQSIEQTIQSVISEAKEQGIVGNAITPFLLQRVNELTAGKSLASNIELVQHNAKIGSQIAMALSKVNETSQRTNKLSNPSRQNDRVQNTDTNYNSRVMVFGGAVLDIIAKSAQDKCVSSTSNVGTIDQHWGGVGRNIAEALCRLGQAPIFISAVGSDGAGEALVEHCLDLGMSPQGLQFPTGQVTAKYTAILDARGQMLMGIADMNVFDHLDIEEQVFEDAPDLRYVVMDGNISPEKMCQIAQVCHTRNLSLWFEPTSCEKALRAIPCLAQLAFISPNREELEVMARAIRGQDLEAEEGEPQDQDRSLVQVKHHARIVLEEMMAVSSWEKKYAIVSLGQDGVLLGVGKSQNQEIQFKHITLLEDQVLETMQNCTGAGDTLVAGTLYGLLHAFDVEQSVRMGMAAARKTIQSSLTIHPELSTQDCHR